VKPKKDFWMVKHPDLSPNFFDVWLLIVQLFYDSNKYKNFGHRAFDLFSFLFPFWLNDEHLTRQNSLQNSIKC
jgi:hypothetical protein